ncbi:hypothetical protein A3754_02645 [Alcanivorax sp. HI0083]|jgi:hypothetical protein|uniref:hypothetical protein n=1 Tax=unclassified Alcanivorax TaxID=2638842 RepID=UPI0007B891DE|nr:MULTISPECIES: hypothetical protein [unclassified Alcanivorax]KZY35805.1 hypothetical protein A3730_14015 [Alcanivorax sp. HI0044]KZZ24638.1 hypothetical protein A3754_02645 [Alcanivorax sp. HI0083]
MPIDITHSNAPFIPGPALYQQLAILNGLLILGLSDKSSEAQQIQHLSLDHQQHITLFRGSSQSRFGMAFRFHRQDVEQIEGVTLEDGRGHLLLHTRPAAIQSLTFMPGKTATDTGYNAGTLSSVDLLVPANRLEQAQAALTRIFRMAGSSWSPGLPPHWQGGQG